jgi:hypothetical protein
VEETRESALSGGPSQCGFFAQGAPKAPGWKTIIIEQFSVFGALNSGCPQAGYFVDGACVYPSFAPGLYQLKNNKKKADFVKTLFF